MAKKDRFTKILAVIGTLLACFPILAPFIFSLIRYSRVNQFQIDYLMPAELFPLALLGGVLLFWAAVRARSHRGLIGWGLVVAAGMLIGSQALAVVTGLASGAREAAGWPWLLVLALLALYVLALLLIDAGGILLLGDLFRRRAPAVRPAPPAP